MPLAHPDVARSYAGAMSPTPAREGDFQLSPDGLTDALRSSGVLGAGHVTVARVEPIGGEAGLLSTTVRVHLDYAGDAGGAPPSVVVKSESEREVAREFAARLRAFEREVRFYREVAPRSPLRLAELYFADDRPGHGALVMEDLSGRPAGDQLAGLSAHRAKATVTEIARLHAAWWDSPALDGLSWMPADPLRSDDDFARAWTPFRERYADRIGPEAMAVAEARAEARGAIRDAVARRPCTIAHGDLRGDNVLFGPDDEVIPIDWQLSLRTLGALDAARLIAGSETPGERRGHEMEAFAAWHDALRAAGVDDYSWDEALDDLRLGLLAYLDIPICWHRNAIAHGGREAALIDLVIERAFELALNVEAERLL